MTPEKISTFPRIVLLFAVAFTCRFCGVQAQNLIQTTWGQSVPYNSMCPMANLDLERADAGSIAVAMAQVMKYYNWPMIGLGNHDYTDADGQMQNVAFNVIYDWEQMPNSIVGVEGQISQLIFHCGASVGTNYTDPDDITICFNNIAGALQNNFDYRARLVEKNDYALQEWAALIENEINCGRPVIIETTQTPNGPVGAVVVDGYPSGHADPNRFHQNVGLGMQTGTTCINIQFATRAIIGIEPNTVLERPTGNSPVCVGEPLRLFAPALAPGGGSIRLNGQNQHITIPFQSIPMDQYTIEFWMKPAQPSGPIIEITFSGNENDKLVISYSGNDIYLRKGNYSDPLQQPGNSPLNLGQWKHLVLVYNSGSFALFINGVAVGNPFPVNGDHDIKSIDIGAVPFFYYSGEIDDFRVWCTALTPEVIQNWRCREVNDNHPRVCSLIRYYKFNNEDPLGDFMSNVQAISHNGYTPLPSQARYIWTGPNGFTSTLQNPVIPNCSENAGGVYRLSASPFNDPLQLAPPLLVRVQKETKPKATSNTPVYQGQTINLTANTRLVPGGGHINFNNPNAEFVTPNLKAGFAQSDITLEIWFNITNSAGEIIEEWGSLSEAGNYIVLLKACNSSTPGNYAIEAGIGGLKSIKLGYVTRNTWNHAVLRYNSTTKVFDGFLNGIPSSLRSRGIRMSFALLGHEEIFVLGKHYGGNSNYGGFIDEFRIWNTALSNEVITGWRNRELDASHPNYNSLVAYYKFNQGEVLNDSKNANNGTAQITMVSVVADQYQWRKDDDADRWHSQLRDPSRSNAQLENAGNYHVYSTSPSGCRSYDSINRVEVLPYQRPTVSLAQRFRAFIRNARATITCSSRNQGPTPNHAWIVEVGNTVSATSSGSNPSYEALFHDGDKITCVTLSNAANVSPVDATSNTLTMRAVDAILAGGAASNSPLCQGSTLQLSTTAALTSGLQNVTFEWTGPGNFSSTVQNPQIPDATKDMDGNYCVIATSSSGYKIAASVDVQIGEPLMCVIRSAYPEYPVINDEIQIPPLSPAAFSVAGYYPGDLLNIVALSLTAAYQWLVNGVPVAGATAGTFTVSQPADGDVVTCNISTDAACGIPQPVVLSPSPVTVQLVDKEIPAPYIEAKDNGPNGKRLFARGMAPGGGHVELQGSTKQNIRIQIKKVFTDFTCELWVKPKSFSTNNVYFSMISGNGESIAVLRQTSPLSMRLEIGNAICDIPYAPSLNHWTHMVVTRSGSQAIIYADGVIKGMATLNGSWPSFCKELEIGANAAQISDNTFDGCIDEFRLWDNALPYASLMAWQYKELQPWQPDYHHVLSYLRFNTDKVLYDEVSQLNAFSPLGSAAKTADFWKYHWDGEDAPVAHVSVENIDVQTGSTTCRVYSVKAVAPDGRESPWSDAMPVSDINAVIPAAGAFGAGGTTP